jgi:hypothetical protein
MRRDSERSIGPEGQTRIVFTAGGNVCLEVPGEKAEHRALRKNFDSEVTAGGVTLSVRDFSYHHDGVPSYSAELATLVDSVVHGSSEESAVRILDQLKSVVIASHRRAHEAIGKNDHARFRNYVITLSKQLGRPPTRSELRKSLGCTARRITQLCEANGFSWLRRGKECRPPKK